MSWQPGLVPGGPGRQSLGAQKTQSAQGGQLRREEPAALYYPTAVEAPLVSQNQAWDAEQHPFKLVFPTFTEPGRLQGSSVLNWSTGQLSSQSMTTSNSSLR